MARRWGLLSWLMASLLATSCASSSDDAGSARRRCEELRDHLVDLRFASAQQSPFDVPTMQPPSPGHTEPVPPPPPLDVAAHRAAMKQALGADFIAACQRDLSRAQVECALGAKDQAAVDVCATSTSKPSPSATAKTAAK